ncbi:MAG TPA: signal peptide prediction [Ramlibacter sp.]|nr:signal peptide prediction [Ramlibacter sp.]
MPVRLLRFLWAAPCTLVGLALGVGVVGLGGSVRRCGQVLEFALHESLAQCGGRVRRLPYRAITFGHVVVAVTHQELRGLRAHELVHVRQYERWGLLFFFAYVASSAWQLLRGRRPYWDNHFEIQARISLLRGGERAQNGGLESPQGDPH